MCSWNSRTFPRQPTFRVRMSFTKKHGIHVVSTTLEVFLRKLFLKKRGGNCSPPWLRPWCHLSFAIMCIRGSRFSLHRPKFEQINIVLATTFNLYCYCICYSIIYTHIRMCEGARKRRIRAQCACARTLGAHAQRGLLCVCYVTPHLWSVCSSWKRCHVLSGQRIEGENLSGFLQISSTSALYGYLALLLAGPRLLAGDMALRG